MGVPSVVKIKKGNVEYTGKVDIAKYTMRQLTRRALQDVARYVLYHVTKKVNAIPHIKQTAKNKKSPSKYFGGRYQSWVLSRENYLQLGIENTKHGAVTAWWADQAELGTNRQPKRAILHDTVYDNIDKIREIESQYLSYLNDEAAAMNAIRDVPEEAIVDDGSDG